MSNRDYKPTPTIMLKGQWLEEFGFKAGGKVNVHCEGGKITITTIADTMNESISSKPAVK